VAALFSRRFGWVLRAGLTDYRQALTWQRGLVTMRRDGLARDTIILLEHPPVITVGRDGHDENFADSPYDPVFIERGGDVTYHGPGQLVAYFIFDLTRRGRDLHRFMGDLQQGVIRSMAQIGIECRKDDDHTGLWVGQRKLGSVGIAVKRWVTFHGVAINLNTDLSEFACINPCGLESDVMVSAAEVLGKPVDLNSFGDKLIEQYSDIFVTQFEPVTPESLAEDMESQAGGFTV